MSLADKLERLAAGCKCGVSVEVNEHRNCYETVRDALRDFTTPEEIAADVRAQMIERDTMVSVQFYPNTPVGFYVVRHYDIEAALDMALAIMEKEPE